MPAPLLSGSGWKVLMPVACCLFKGSGRWMVLVGRHGKGVGWAIGVGGWGNTGLIVRNDDYLVKV